MHAQENAHARSPRFIETAIAVLDGTKDASTREAAELVVGAEKLLQKAISRLLMAGDRAQMEQILAEIMPEAGIAVRVITMGLELMEGPIRPPSRNNLFKDLRTRGGTDEVIERIRLGLLAADDEAALLRFLPGGIQAHPMIQQEDSRGRFLLMAIATWIYSDRQDLMIWDDLTFAFLDSASRAFGLVSAAVNEDGLHWSSKVA
ncbi:hypothetical protein [Enhygromyxa salina]|uniref:hypothetical protein n=1 Tax=Enhygromyxa salina TaxID=215803 RepID=UPI0011BADADB|nr:hypothetical protein [Enhygromyxa salina]